MARILLVSDDHCYTRCFGRQAPDGTVIFATRTEKLSEFVKIEAKCDFVIHAGDFENDINWIKKYSDYFVEGNQDRGYKGSGQIKEFVIANHRFVLLHGDGYFTKTGRDKWSLEVKRVLKKAQHYPDFIIYGHNHVQSCENKTWPILINPGSLNFPRDSKFCHQWAVLEINEQTYCLELWGLKKRWHPGTAFTDDYEDVVVCEQIIGAFKHG